MVGTHVLHLLKIGKISRTAALCVLLLVVSFSGLIETESKNVADRIKNEEEQSYGTTREGNSKTTSGFFQQDSNAYIRSRLSDKDAIRKGEISGIGAAVRNVSSANNNSFGSSSTQSSKWRTFGKWCNDKWHSLSKWIGRKLVILRTRIEKSQRPGEVSKTGKVSRNIGKENVESIRKNYTLGNNSRDSIGDREWRAFGSWFMDKMKSITLSILGECMPNLSITIATGGSDILNGETKGSEIIENRAYGNKGTPGNVIGRSSRNEGMFEGHSGNKERKRWTLWRKKKWNVREYCKRKWLSFLKWCNSSWWTFWNWCSRIWLSLWKWCKRTWWNFWKWCDGIRLILWKRYILPGWTMLKIYTVKWGRLLWKIFYLAWRVFKR